MRRRRRHTMEEMLTGRGVFLAFPCTATMSKVQGQAVHPTSLACGGAWPPRGRKSDRLVASWEYVAQNNVLLFVVVIVRRFTSCFIRLGLFWSASL